MCFSCKDDVMCHVWLDSHFTGCGRVFGYQHFGGVALNSTKRNLKKYLFNNVYYLRGTEEQHNKGHIYHTISHICHNKILCPLGNFVACDWLS